VVGVDLPPGSRRMNRRHIPLQRLPGTGTLQRRSGILSSTSMC
jgi:hypothetical protein